MTDGDPGCDHGRAAGDGEHAPERVLDSERGHDHAADHETDNGRDGQTHGDGQPHGDGDADSDDGHQHTDDEQQHADDGHHHAADAEAVNAAVVTVSSSRRLEEDVSGDAVVELLEDDGHEVVTRELVQDDFDGVQGAVSRLANRDDVDAIVTTGGTGVTPDDVTPEAVEPLMNKQLNGFGEEFRRRSIDDVGLVALLSRATAGVVDDTIVAVLPGSESAARMGTTLLVQILGHFVGLATLPRGADHHDG